MWRFVTHHPGALGPERGSRFVRSRRTRILQYFIGLPSFEEEPPFHPSLMTHFRKRLGPDVINQVNEWIVMEKDESDDSDDRDDGHPGQAEVDATSKPSTDKETPANQGKLLLDATCAPANIAYPTDLSLLNEAREKLEKMIDVLHAVREPGSRKPHTYREKARKVYLAVAKQRRVSPRALRKAIGKQLSLSDIQTTFCHDFC